MCYYHLSWKSLNRSKIKKITLASFLIKILIEYEWKSNRKLFGHFLLANLFWFYLKVIKYPYTTQQCSKYVYNIHSHICALFDFRTLCTVWFSYTVHCLIFQMCRYWKKFTYSYGGFTKYDFEAQVKILKNLISHEINSLLFHICQHFFILWINSCCIHHFHWIIDVQQKRYFSVTWFSI